MSSLRGRNQQTIFDNSVSTCLGWRRSSDSTAANLTTKSVSPHGINYGKEEDLPTPSFIKISGHIYSRLLNAEDDGTLRYYVHDATYRRNKKLPLETLRIVRDCISAKNNLAQELRRFSQMPNMEELIVTIETNPSNIGAPDVAALYVRTKGDTTTHPRRLVIYPTRKSFRDAHPDLDDTRGQNGLFVPSSHEMYEPLLYPLLAIGGTSNPGYGAHYFQPTLAGKVTLQNYTRYRTLSIEREQEADGTPSSGPSTSRPRPLRRQQRRATHPTRSQRSSY